MTFKILVVDTYYFEFLEKNQLTQLQTKLSYSELISEIESMQFGTGSAYVHYLRELGWHASLVVPNCFTSQSTWAREFLNVKLSKLGWKYAIHFSRLPFLSFVSKRFKQVHWTLLKQIELAKPDVVYIQDINLLPSTLLKEVKRHTKKLVGEIASPLPPKRFIADYDLIVSALPTILEKANALGVDTAYLPLGFDERNVLAVTPPSRDIDAIFVGSFYNNQPNTYEMLKLAQKQIPGLRIYGPSGKGVLEKHGLISNYFGEAWGQEMFSLLERSKIVLNRHGSAAGDFAVNMRMYEATGMGAGLITETKSNLLSLFVPGVEVETYSSPAEAVEKAKQLLDDPQRLQQLQENGKSKTLKSHTYRVRMKDLSEILKEQIITRN